MNGSFVVSVSPDVTPLVADRAPVAARGPLRAAGFGNTRAVRRMEGHDGGDGRAWLDEVYALHGREIFGFTRRVTGDPGLAEEVTQDVFVRAWRAREQFDGRRASLRTWLFQIARNACIDAHRARSVRPALAEDAAASVDAPSADVVDRLADRWVMEEALRRLSDDHRLAIVHVHLHGRTYADAGSLLEVPPGTVKSRVFHGLKQLREIVESDDVFEGRLR